MHDFFEFIGKDYEGKITINPIDRIIPIILSVIIIILIFLFRNKFKMWKHQTTFRKIIGICLFLIWLSYYLWYILNKKFGAESLPISLCALASIGFIIVFLNNNHKILDIVFYWGIIGGLLAMLFASDIYRGPDHYRYYEFYLDHGILFIAPFYFMFIYNYIPTLKSTLKSLIALIIAGFLTLPVNLTYQMDYMIMNPYNPPINTPAYDIAKMVNNNLFAYVSVLFVLSLIVFVVLYYIMYIISYNVRKELVR